MSSAPFPVGFPVPGGVFLDMDDDDMPMYVRWTSGGSVHSAFPVGLSLGVM